jgi:hypothetical protein
MTKDEMIEWFKSAPKGSRHEHMLWAAWKIARLTGVMAIASGRVLIIFENTFWNSSGVRASMAAAPI